MPRSISFPEDRGHALFSAVDTVVKSMKVEFASAQHHIDLSSGARKLYSEILSKHHPLLVLAELVDA